ncbi:MAG: primary-amine oxidase [Chloroflexi bacterium]|nr:primary-amine oxidase [Chloroflexota bacterium]MYD47202.1 primary-amine oxidase [Chloroflexota bacterium]
MTIAIATENEGAVTSSVSHPLDPLTPQEIAEASAILKEERRLGPRVRFETVVLREPAKDAVLNFKPGTPIRRDVFLVVLDNDGPATYEAVVSLDDRRVVSWEHIPGVQPRVMFDEFVECEAAVRADPRFQAAIKKRGIADPSLVMVDPWSAGNYGFEDEEGRRLVLARNFVRSSPTDNGYARPIEGVTAVVDLNSMEVLRVDDYGVIPLPPEPGNYAAEFVGGFRQDLKPLDISQPEGASFQVDGWSVTWQKWHIRIGFTPREGLVIHTVGYEDRGRVRPILYRAALSDMVVPYGDPGKDHYRKNAFDAGEYGIGSLTNSLTLGCDCLGEIYYFDAALNDGRGEPFTIPNAVCMHEEDYGILWKHTDWRTGQTEVRRSRRLVVSSVATVGNYEYGFFWYFYQDGAIEVEVKLTGIINTAGIAEGETPKYGTLVAPQLNAHIHQHFFNFRLDMSVDGEDNSVFEVNTVAEPPGPDNPHGNAFYAEKAALRTEWEAQRVVDPMKARYWLVSNPAVTNALGQPVSYKLMPGENILPFAHPDASIIKRAGFMTKHLWVTPYDRDEISATGPYPNQHPGGAGLPEYTRNDRNVENTDVVLWYTLGYHHVPRPEDWPISPVAYCGFSLKPVGFFDINPVLDVPPSAHHETACHP